jgi:hypothetical protein
MPDRKPKPKKTCRECGAMQKKLDKAESEASGAAWDLAGMEDERDKLREDLRNSQEAQGKLAIERDMWMATAKNFERANHVLQGRIDFYKNAHEGASLLRSDAEDKVHRIACESQQSLHGMLIERAKVSDLISGLQKMQGKWWFQGVKQDIADLLVRYSDDGAIPQFYNHSKEQQ